MSAPLQELSWGLWIFPEIDGDLYFSWERGRGSGSGRGRGRGRGRGKGRGRGWGRGREGERERGRGRGREGEKERGREAERQRGREAELPNMDSYIKAAYPTCRPLFTSSFFCCMSSCCCVSTSSGSDSASGNKCCRTSSVGGDHEESTRQLTGFVWASGNEVKPNGLAFVDTSQRKFEKNLRTDKALLWRRANARNVSQHTLYGVQPYVDTFYVSPPRRRRPKLVLTGTSIPFNPGLAA